MQYCEQGFSRHGKPRGMNRMEDYRVRVGSTPIESAAHAFQVWYLVLFGGLMRQHGVGDGDLFFNSRLLFLFVDGLPHGIFH